MSASPPGPIERTGLDLAAYDRVQDAVGRAKMRELVGKLRAQLEGRFDWASEADPDRDRLRSEAHKLVSAAGMLGFAELSQASAALQKACLDGSPVAVPLERVRLAQRRALDLIAAIRSEPD